jgi:O-antigen/teichoic acid export membrane protein
MSTETGQTLRTQAVKSAAWYGASRLWGQLVSWAVTILLARLLVPADYGLFAMALSVLKVLELLQEFGLGTAIVQRQNLTREQTNGVFWVVTATSLVLTGGTFLAADAISEFYGEARLSGALQVLCLTFLLNSIGLVPYNLLTRALDLRHRAMADAMGAAASALVGLGLAYHGFGVWALLLGHLVRAVVLNGALIIFARWLPGFRVAREGMRSLVTFGLRIAGMHVMGNMSPAVCTFIVGRLLGGTALGLYGMAESLAEAPHRISTSIINQVSFPVFSRLQDDRDQLASYFLKITKCLALVSLPAQIGLVLVAPDLVPILLSSKWDGVVLPFQILCVESAVIVISLTATPLLTALGRGTFLLRGTVVSLVSISTATFVGAWFGLVGIAVARLIVMIPLRIGFLLPCLWTLRLPFGAYLNGIRSPMMSVGVMTVGVLIVQHIFPNAGGVERVAISAAAGAVAYGTSLYLFDRGLVRDARTIVSDLLSRRSA